MPEITDTTLLQQLNGGAAAPSSGGIRPITIGRRDPKLSGQLEGQGLNNTGQAISNARGSATLPFEGPKAAADLNKTQGDVADRPFNNADTLAKRFEGQQAVKEYRTVVPILLAGLQTAPTPQGDSALIYNYAKIMDPGSVVRESEGEAAANTAGFWDAKVEKFKKDFGYDGARGLPVGAAKGLRDEMNRKVAQLAKSYGVQRADYQKFAQARGVDPFQVVGSPPASPQQIDEYKRVMGDRLKDQANAIATPQDRKIDPTGANALLPPSDRDFLSRNARTLGEDGIRDFFASRGLNVPQGEIDAAVEYYAKGGQQDAAVNVPQGEGSAWGKFAASPVGTGMYAAVDAGMGGMTDEFASMAGGGDLADLNARKQAAFAANPASSFAGQTIGTIGGMAALGGLSRGAGVASRFSNPQLVGDMAFGAASGAGQNNDNRLTGATLGATGGFVGNRVGDMASRGIGAIARTQPGLAVTNRARGFFGRLPISRADPLSSAEGTALGALNRSGIDDVRSSLTEASGLDIPMALADTNPNLRELAGAAVRRSPSASAYAENALIPRNRAQYDRFTAAVERDLGPTANIPQLSADMMTQARSAASDLYDAAYRQTIPSTPELDGTLATPFGRQALGRARTIAANERRDPQAMGFRLDAEGNVILEPGQPMSLTGAGRDGGMPVQQPAYTTQTLDYVKRGMDDVLEEKRNPITGRLVLDEAGRAQNGVRGQLLSEVDRLNPDYAAARAAYAGPMASRDALARGGDAYSLHPHELAMQVGNQTPEHLGQMQLGYRGALVDHAGRVRDNSNPWEATLGSPVARDRLSSIYPATPGVDRMLRSRELEVGMQQTTNAILGNSRTARNQIADQSFLENPMVEGALHAGAALTTHGASVPGTAARILSAGLKNRLALGMGKRAEVKADALAPILLNPDPAAGLSAIDDIVARDLAYQAFIQASRPKSLRMFGAGVGSQAATIPLGQ